MFKLPPETVPMLWGAAGGAAALAIVGFTWGGWSTKSAAETQAARRADAAVVQALAPICAENFRKHANATANLAEMKKMQSWDQGKFVANGGWATMPGASEPSSGVAEACARLIEMPKS
jgi:hypothetical protein